MRPTHIRLSSRKFIALQEALLLIVLQATFAPKLNLPLAIGLVAAYTGTNLYQAKKSPEPAD